MKVISISVLISFSMATQAQSLSAFERQALGNSPLVARALADARAFRARGQGLRAPFRPMVSLTGVGAFGDDSAIFATAFEPSNYLLAMGDPIGIGSVMAMWRVYSGGRDRSAAGIASALLSEGDAQVAQAKLDVVRDVRVAFAEASAAEGAKAARAAGVAAAVELLQVSEQRFQAGSAPEAFVLKARADLARAQRQHALAEADAVSKTAVLKEAVGMDQQAQVESSEWDVPLEAPATLEESIAGAEIRPEVRIALARKAAFDQRSRSARQSAYPELNLVGMGTGMATETESGVFYKVGLVLSVPLLDGGMRRAEAQEMKAMADGVDHELRALRLRIAREVASAWAAWQAAPKAIAASDAEIASAEEAFRIAKLRYTEGKAPQVEVEQASADLVEALAGRADANAFRQIAWANLMWAVGKSPDQEDQNQ